MRQRIALLNVLQRLYKGAKGLTKSNVFQEIVDALALYKAAVEEALKQNQAKSIPNQEQGEEIKQEEEVKQDQGFDLFDFLASCFNDQSLMNKLKKIVGFSLVSLTAGIWVYRYYFSDNSMDQKELEAKVQSLEKNLGKEGIESVRQNVKETLNIGDTLDEDSSEELSKAVKNLHAKTILDKGFSEKVRLHVEALYSGINSDEGFLEEARLTIKMLKKEDRISPTLKSSSSNQKCSKPEKQSMLQSCIDTAMKHKETILAAGLVLSLLGKFKSG